MGKAEENKRVKRSRLLETAFNLFTTRGAADTSVSDMAKEAGVGKGTFYLYFKGKDDIEARIISHRTDQMFSHAFKLLEGRDGISFEDKLIIVLNDILDQFAADHMLLKFIYKNLSWGVFKSAMEMFSTEDKFSSYEAFNRLITKEQHKWEDPDMMFFAIIELVSSTCYEVIMRSDPVPLEKYRKYMNSYIRSIIRDHEISDTEGEAEG